MGVGDDVSVLVNNESAANALRTTLGRHGEDVSEDVHTPTLDHDLLGGRQVNHRIPSPFIGFHNRRPPQLAPWALIALRNHRGLRRQH